MKIKMTQDTQFEGGEFTPKYSEHSSGKDKDKTKAFDRLVRMGRAVASGTPAWDALQSAEAAAKKGSKKSAKAEAGASKPDPGLGV